MTRLEVPRVPRPDCLSFCAAQGESVRPRGATIACAHLSKCPEGSEWRPVVTDASPWGHRR
eukprot:6851696-Lingulodinium_polyedra.AAC.1